MSNVLPMISTSPDLTPIQEFYQNSTIFITGCTGFLGQLLLEKLLRSCPDVTIYVMIRNKKGKTMQARLEEIFNSVLFQKLSKEYPEFRNKVEIIEGDCSLKNLGISETNRSLLIEQVNIVFHMAATVRFDENLKCAVNTNIRATEDILKLSKEMKNLKSFMYVSTLFANCPRKTIDETFYPAALEYKQIMNLAESLPDHVVDTVTPGLLGEYPNTYAFTKQIAENVVETIAKGLPLGVFRPAIVVPTYREPLRGWINNIYGPTGYGAGIASGLIRIGEADLSCNANIIPADMTTNFLIASAWDIGKEYTKNNDSFHVKIYNYASSIDKPVTWSDLFRESYETGVEIGSLKCIWHPEAIFTKYHIVYLVMEFFLHTIPARVIDFIRICIGKPPFLTKTYRKIHKFTQVIASFSKTSWTIRAKNYRKLCDEMSAKDKEIFFCDLKTLDWIDFFRDYYLGVRLYLLNDPIETLEAGRKLSRRLYWQHQILKTIFALITLRLLWYVISVLHDLLF